MGNTATVTVSLPDVITVEAWLAFSDGRQTYLDQQAAADKTAYNAIADYHGACAVYRAGFVHISGANDVLVAKLKDVLNNTTMSGIDIAFIGWAVREIAGPINRAIGRPLLDSTPQSSGTESTLTDTALPAP
jgi:hypothetical protein